MALLDNGGIVENFEAFERALHELFAEAQCEVTAEALERADVDLPYVLIDGEIHHRAVRCAKTYTGASGPVMVNRTLYRRARDERSVAALELRVGMVEGQWTPLAARQGALLVTHVTPGEAEEVFAELGGMCPSKSSLDRLPKALSQRWEVRREAFEATLRERLEVPEKACTVAVSLDGVMVPMKDGARQEKRAHSAARGKRTKGPAGYQEVGCATLSFFDADGDRLDTVRFARMPEPKKARLKAILTAELEAVLASHPELRLVKLADGAKDNWTFLSEDLSEGVELVEFYHAAQHLKAGFDAAYGENSPKANAQFAKYRRILRDDPDGVETVIRALVYQCSKHPRRTRIAQARNYFRAHRHRMGYDEAKAQNLPIGSGIVEAACKTLATQRMKRSGMRWRHGGGQAILTLRALVQSNRFDDGWSLLSNTYRANVAAPENVVPLRRMGAR
jgi:hypothetical protein